MAALAGAAAFVPLIQAAVVLVNDLVDLAHQHAVDDTEAQRQLAEIRTTVEATRARVAAFQP